MPTDTERLDWLEKQPGAVLVSTDEGRWAVTEDVVDKGDPERECIDGTICEVMAEAEMLKPTIREAIDEAMQLDQGDDDATDSRD
jgi:hypothetical protein